MNVDEYLRNARSCLELASQQTAPMSKATLINMATTWSRLAEQAVKNRKADLVYEPPLPRAPLEETPLAQQQLQIQPKPDSTE
jgi:hypothetical protein